MEKEPKSPSTPQTESGSQSETESTPEQKPEQTQRSREAIEADITQLDTEEKQVETEATPLKQQIEALGAEAQIQIDTLLDDIEKNIPTDAEIQSRFSGDLLPIALAICHISTRLQTIQNKRTALHTEFTPYRREDFGKLLYDASSRFDYNAMFNYYRDDKSEDGFTLYSTAADLYRLRYYQKEWLDAGPLQSFDHYDMNCRSLKDMQETWDKKGFLRDKAQQDFTPYPEFGEKIKTEQRELLVSFLREILEQLDHYNTLSHTYHFGINKPRVLDRHILEIFQIFDMETPENSRLKLKNFSEVDFDPYFILAAAEHVEKLTQEHRRLGHLPADADARRKEQERINALPNLELSRSVKFEGFNVPGGLEALVTPESIVDEIAEILPPDFLRGLRSITRKDKSNDPDEPGVETVGSFFPQFDRRGDAVGGDIEVYRKICTCAPESVI